MNKTREITQADVLFEDNHIIAINKSAGQIVQGDKTGDTPLSEYVKQFLKIKYNKPGNVFAGVTHRIDRPVSGIVLFAKTSKALERLNQMFQEKKIKKTYLAVSRFKPEPENGTLVHYLVKNQKNNKSYAYEKEVHGSLKSELNYELVNKSDKYFLIKVDPKTGRHHQIRVQLAKMGCVITGDVKYGDKRANEDQSVCLHAYQIQFQHPVSKEEIRITAPLPDFKYWNPFRQFLANQNFQL